MELLIGIIAFIILFSVIYTSIRTRQNKEMIALAKYHIRKDLLSREGKPINEILEKCNLNKEKFSSGRRVLEILSSVVGVPTNKFDASQLLGEILSYGNLEPFTYEIIEQLSLHSDKEKWEDCWKNTPNLPYNEDELGDLIMSMDIGRFTRFFSPLMEE